MSAVSMNIEFAGVTLPVHRNEDGKEVVPLKPLVEGLGLDWMRQYRKAKTEFVAEILGTCIGQLPYAGQVREVVCIDLCSVEYFLIRLSPEQVAAGGNVEAAEKLKVLHHEWKDVLHDYEVLAGRYGDIRRKQLQNRQSDIRNVTALARQISQTSDTEIRKALTAILKQECGRLGVPFQQELAVGE